MFVELTQMGKRFWSQMVANKNSDFSEYGFGGFIGESSVSFFGRFVVLIKRESRSEKRND